MSAALCSHLPGFHKQQHVLHRASISSALCQACQGAPKSRDSPCSLHSAANKGSFVPQEWPCQALQPVLLLLESFHSTCSKPKFLDRGLELFGLKVFIKYFYQLTKLLSKQPNPLVTTLIFILRFCTKQRLLKMLQNGTDAPFYTKRVDFTTLKHLKNGKQQFGFTKLVSGLKSLPFFTQMTLLKASTKFCFSLTVLQNLRNKLCFHLSL